MHALIAPSAVLAAALALCAPSWAASSSPWHRAHGADIRLVVAAPSAGQGELRGALEIRLQPGWKTYWLDPGDAGVPPTVSVAGSTNGTDARLLFPAPTRFEDRYASWAGYGAPVAFALVIDLDDAHAETRLAIDVFLGICEDVCIPVQARFELDPGEDGFDPQAEMVVEMAFASLPEAESEGFRAEVVGEEEAGVAVALALPDGAEPLDLFVAGTAGRSFGAPWRSDIDGVPAYVVPYNAPPAPGGRERAFYTLVTTAGSVSGELLLGR